ncbi:beta-lactamase family protein [Novosphingobium profundi]|uniref:serine hydrolase domain-containing protein n=1 Tax=Novosphingobium profundi TaxID=1774954 RepID=UPI001BDA1663|nr:serine hydrolase domain-containing protein [Novosphingobium profundi]MBT0667358.1 beta-lactamase family protein [Novosphingobium profundi]
MHRGLTSGLVFAIAAITSCAASAQPPARSPIPALLTPYVEQGDIGGYVTITSVEGAPPQTDVKGWSDVASRRPMKADTIFRAFSMTKPVTGVALMVLFDEGKWHFDDPISDYLPELKDMKVFRGLDAQGAPILSRPASPPTMRQLVTHTAGFLYGFGDSYVDHLYQQRLPLVPKAQTAAAYLATLATIPLAYEPGTQWHYSVSMDLEGIIIERLSGQSLASFMEQRIFHPLAMNDTGFSVPSSKADRLATLYEYRDGGLKPVTSGPFWIASDAPDGLKSGGAGLFTTAPDYARFASMLLNGGQLDGVRVLSAKSASAIMHSQVSEQVIDKGFGIGLQQIRSGYEFGVNGVVVTDPAAAHSSLGKGTYLWDGAASNYFWVDPEHHLSVVTFVQRLVATPPVLPIQKDSHDAIKATYFPSK